MAIHKDDLPIIKTLLERFKDFDREFEELYKETPEFTSDKYLKFASLMQTIELTNQLRSFNRVWREKNGLLSDEEKENDAKIKEYLNS